MNSPTAFKGYHVAAAGTGINLALGVLYTWSIFKDAIRQSISTGGVGSFNWELARLNDPYALCCLVFALMMIVAGRCQDRFGPRTTAITGGVLVGIGFIWISQSTAYLSWVLGFGVLVGSGIAFGYASATPPAMKWFPPNRTGIVAGIVVSGFGLASVYIAPLAKYLLNQWGLQGAMLFFGIAFLLVVSTLALFLVNPPTEYVPPGFVCRRQRTEHHQKAREKFVEHEVPPLTMLKTPTFWLLWTIYFIGAGTGLMVIGSVAGMAKASLGANAFLAVAFLAVGNAAGRVVAGSVSDKIGRGKTLAGIFFFQAVLMSAAVPVTTQGGSNALLLVLLTSLIGFNYGANLAIFPSFAKDLWGIKNFGVNYGLLFTAWGLGGFVMSKASQMLIASSGAMTDAFKAATILLLIGGGLAFSIHNEREAKRKEIKKKLVTAVQT
ncbi:MAG: OFA family MFS transporter [Proteobacteria bacterium]|nr:OFA family MFS transporter [Pseudomonadota bacterium]MBU1687213.1 OFA family MFS transporter [Pseudomonadota bacterium]